LPFYPTIFGVSLFQILNISTIGFFVELYAFKTTYFYLINIQVLITFLTCNINYYWFVIKKDYKSLLKENKAHSKMVKIKKDVGLIVYVF